MDLPDVWRKIKWAEKHIHKLETKIRAIHQPNPYLIVAEPNKDGSHIEWKVVFRRGFQLPGNELGLMAGDAIHNLRSALDHFAYAVVPNPTPETSFPIWRRPTTPTAQQLKALTRGKIKGAPKSVIDAVSGLHSYLGGNHEFLWKLDHLDIIDKHRTVLVVVGDFRSLNIDFGGLMRRAFPDSDTPSMVMGLRGNPDCPVNDGDVLFRVPIDQAADYEDNVTFTFEVAFGEPGVFYCEPVVPALTQLAEAVTDLLETLGAVR